MLDALRGRIANFITGQKSIGGLWGFGDFSHKYEWTRGNALSLYEKSLYANKAIAKRAEKVAEIQFTLTNKKGELVEEHPLLDLLDRPNQYQTGDQFWGLAQKYYDTVGAAYILKKQGETIFNTKIIPDSFELLRADQVEVRLNGAGNEILKFVHHANGKSTEYEPDQIIYLYRPDPRNPLLGESLLASAVRSIETEKQISEYHANVLKNGGRLDTILAFKNVINKQQLDDMRDQYKDKHTEARRLGMPLFLGGEFDKAITSLSPQELAFLDTKVSTLEDIVIATGVPKALLGLTSTDTFANADASIRVFLRETIKPQLKNIVNVLDWRLVPDDLTLGFVDPTPEDTEVLLKRLKTADEVHALTINEQREVLGFEPIPEGDVILVPFSVMPLGEERPEPTATPKDDEEDDKNKGAKRAHPLRNKAARQAYAKMSAARQRNAEGVFLRVVRGYFGQQKERVLSNIGASRKRKGLFDDAYNRTLEIGIAVDTLLPVLREIFEAEAKRTSTAFGFPPFSMSSAAVASLEKRARLFSDSIINTTADQLQRAFAESFEAGESRQQLVNRIEDLYADISRGRAEVIARTEVHAAAQDGAFAAYSQAGMETKIWVTVGDERVRDEHEAMDGEEVPLHAVFSNWLMYPSEPNCRCSI